MRRVSRFFGIAVALVAMLALAAGVAQAKTKMVSKVDSFVLFVDHSGSMDMNHGEADEDKIVLAKDLLQKLNAKIPGMEYDSRLATFAPTSRRFSGMYDRAAMGKAIDGIQTDYGIYGRLTPMGGGLADIKPSLDALPGRVAVIIFSDGQSNTGLDPVAQANEIYNAYRGRVCFHVVSLADEAVGQATLDAIAKLSSCTVSASATDLLADEAALDKFVMDVFYDIVEVAEPKPEPEPVVMVETEVVEVIPLRIQFDFDSSKIRDDMVPILEEAASIIKKTEGDVVLEGHTCNIGTDAYNMGLSDRRAASVKEYLSGLGVDSGRLETVGKGESMPKYDNSTREGRKLNRRVEIIFQ